MAKILVVEDENLIAMDIKHTLSDFGYVVPAVVSSGEEAIRQAEETNPDLVLMDIVLKGNIDGIEAAEKINARFNIPVVYLTAYLDVKKLKQKGATGPFDYIIKPFVEEELQASVKQALGRRKPGMLREN